MLKCFCESTGCEGREVSKRVFDAHSKLDRAAQVRELRAASERVLKDQDEALSTYILLMTLSDKASGTSQHPGGRLWSKSSDDQESAKRISSPCCGGISRHELIDHNLRLLRDIEQSLDKLQADAKHQLASIGVPSARESPFPLKPLIVAVLDIQCQLVSIKLKIPSVNETKASISSKAQDLLANLQYSQSQWIDQANQCIQEPVPKASTDFNTGMRIVLLS